jgi:vitamin B12 transporter
VERKAVRKMSLLPFAWFVVLIVFPLFAQESEDGFSDDDLLLMEAAGITVVGAPETTQQMEVVTKEDIERRQAPDLATLLEETLDMGITRYGGYGNQTEISIRGFDTERIAILIDGVPANSPRSGEFDVSQIDLSNVERIEVIYGGSDSKYNVTGALGGVINIITLKKQRAGLAMGGSVSSTGYVPGGYNLRHSDGATGEARYEDLLDTQQLNFFAGYGAENYSWKLSWFGNRAMNHYLYKDYFGFARRKESNEIWDTGLGFSYTRNLPDAATLLSSTDLYYADKEYPVTGTAEGSAHGRDFSVKESLILDAPRAFRDDLSAEASLSYAFSDMRYGYNTESADQYVTAVSRWGWYPTDKLTLRAGADWCFIHVDSTDDGLRNGNNGGLYLTAEYKPTEKLLLTASVKGATDTKQGVAIPKAGLVWTLADTEKLSFSLKNNYFRSFKFPDFDDLYYRSADGLYAGNPDLKPEDGLGADLMGELAWADSFAASSAVYVQWTEDSIHWVKAGARWRPENVGTGCFVGADFRPSLTIPLPFKVFARIKLGLNYQCQISWLLNDGLDFDNALRIPYMPMHIVGGSVDIPWHSASPEKTGSLLVSAHWESLRYADTLNHMELEPYCLLNVTVNQNIGPHFTAFAIARNALNSLYTSFAEYPMPGITLTVGGRWKLGGRSDER